MQYDVLFPFLAIVAVATYVQSVSGFALGMIVMGSVTTFDLLPITFTSVIISAVALINSAFVIRSDIGYLKPKILTATFIGVLPGLIIGLFLLHYLSDSFNEILQKVLGVAIIMAGISMIIKTTATERPPSKPSMFTLAGCASGLLTGLFSIGGPPLVYIFYRQPFDLKTIRTYLLAVFLIGAICRITLVGIQGQLTLDMLIYSLCCIPVVITVSSFAKRYPPPIDINIMRKIAFCLLIVIGTSLLL